MPEVLPRRPGLPASGPPGGKDRTGETSGETPGRTAGGTRPAPCGHVTRSTTRRTPHGNRRVRPPFPSPPPPQPRAHGRTREDSRRDGARAGPGGRMGLHEPAPLRTAHRERLGPGGLAHRVTGRPAGGGGLRPGSGRLRRRPHPVAPRGPRRDGRPRRAHRPAADPSSPVRDRQAPRADHAGRDSRGTRRGARGVMDGHQDVPARAATGEGGGEPGPRRGVRGVRAPGAPAQGEGDPRRAGRHPAVT